MAKLKQVSENKIETLKANRMINLLPEYAPYFTQTERKPIMAGMPYLSGVKFSGIKKIGYSVIEFVYGTNPECSTDMVLLGQHEISRHICPEFQ